MISRSSSAALTFNSPDAGARVQQLLDLGTTFKQVLRRASGEIKGGILTTPEGQDVYIFSEDMSD